MSENKNITSLNQLKNWFKTGLKPTQAQFWAWLDSFYHKDEEIPQEKITGLAETLENKAETSAVKVKANADASGLTDEQKQAWKEALEVGELPTNIALIDEGDGDNINLGNVYTKTQITELLENSGKNLGNSNIFTTLLGKVTQGANYVWDTASYYFYLKNLPDKSTDSTFDMLMVQDSNGQIAKTNGKSVFKAIPRTFSEAERNQWFADFNGLTSFSGTSIRSVSPPIVSKSSKHQNIIIKGLGLNLIKNINGNQSYVGLIKPNGEEFPASNFSVVGDSQTIIAEFLIDDDYPFGTSKLKVVNGGMEAVGDVYLNVVENLVDIPKAVAGKIITYNNIEVPDIYANTTNFRIGNNIQFNNLKQNKSIAINNYIDSVLLKGNENWWVQGEFEIIGTGYHSNAAVGLTTEAEASNASVPTTIALFSIPFFTNYQSGNIDGMLIKGGKGNVTVDWIKQGQTLAIITRVGNATKVNVVSINTAQNYFIKAIQYATDREQDALNGSITFYKKI